MSIGVRQPPRGQDDALELPIPFGWFALGYGADLEEGAVEPGFAFGQHTVLFRTRDGQAHVADAFCPHLGAHLGHGGRVEGETIVCPFHGWRFDGDGVCRSIPYASTMPRRVAHGPCLFSYPVQERNGMVWAWYHPRRVPPLFDLDTVPEIGDAAWSEPERYEWDVPAPIQETAENPIDVAHFVTVHGTAEMPRASITFDGHRRANHLVCKVPAIDEHGNVDLMRTADMDLVTRSCGPGMSTQTFELGAKTVMLATVTPITSARSKIRFAFTKPKAARPQYEMLASALIAEIVRQMQQDLPIWEHKICRARPILCDGDGPIAKHRRWFAQFYDEADACADLPQTARIPPGQARPHMVGDLVV